MWHAQRLIAISVLTALSASMSTACSDTGSAEPQPTFTRAPTRRPSTTPSVPEGWAPCSNDVEGYSVSYPGDWHTTDVLYGERDRSRACMYFSLEPFDPELGLELNDEGLTYPIQIYTQGSDAATIVGSRGVEVVTQADVMIAGLPAVRLETIRTRAALGEPEGAYYRYLVEMPDGRTFTFILAEHVDPTHYEDHKAVLDRLVSTLTLG